MGVFTHFQFICYACWLDPKCIKIHLFQKTWKILCPNASKNTKPLLTLIMFLTLYAVWMAQRLTLWVLITMSLIPKINTWDDLWSPDQRGCSSPGTLVSPNTSSKTTHLCQETSLINCHILILIKLKQRFNLLQDSILDIKVPVFKPGGQVPEIKSYMDSFPFPFYIILRDINSLPMVLSDALRQWFELVTAVDRWNAI